MANLFDPDGRQRQIVIRIPRFEIGEHFTVYSVEIGLGQFKWSVNRRFSEFASLHDELVAQHKLRDVELPAKRIFNNQSVTFVQRRQKELEEYLRGLFKIYPRPPPPLSRFTLWDKYEIHGITATMSAYVLGMANSQSNADGGAGWRQPFEFSVLQVHAINARVLSPAPTNDLTHMKFDMGHIMNFATHLPAVRIWGSSGHFGTSTIVMNQLPYDLSIFKAIDSLQLINVDLTRLKGLDQLKETLTKLCVHNTLQTLKEILLQDLIDSDFGQDSTMVRCWSRIVEADFSNNSLRMIDESVKLLPNVQKLNLSGNQIPAITNLEHLSELQRLNLSKNGITDLINLNAKLGNIKELILVENRLTSLLGLSRVYSLQSLDVSKNQISELIEVCHIGRLPCLEHLRLADNPVTLVPDYRTKVFEQFGERAPEVKLDGRHGSQKELDTAAVLQALQRAKERPGPPRTAASTMVSTSADSRSSGGGHSRNVASTGSPLSLPRHSAVRPSSLVPERGPTGSAGETLDREKMESLRSRGGKRWLLEYNQMLDQHQRQQQQQQQHEEAEAGAEAGGGSQAVRQLTIGQPSEAVRTHRDSSASLSKATESRDSSVSASEAPASVQFETRLELSLARLLLLPSPPELAAYAPALPLLPDAGEENGVPWGGAVAVTSSGRLLVVLRQEGNEFALALNLEAANLAQLVRGYRGLYLRLEERFAGPDGVAVLVTMRAAATDRLVELLSRHSGLAIVSLEARRKQQLEEYVALREGPSQLGFYSIALFRGPGLRYLVSVAVSRRRLHLLDERLATLPPPLGASGDADLSFAPLGAYRRRDLELPAVTEEADSVSEEEADAAFFLWPLRLRLRARADRAGALDELRLDFNTEADRGAFQEALQALEDDVEPEEEEEEAEEAEVEAIVRPPEQRRLDFERWDALSAAVKHRVAQSPDSGCPMRRLIDMDSADLARFFANHVQPQLDETDQEEQLVAVMWAYWLHYRSRAPESLACVFLTSRAIYVTFDPPGSSGEESLALRSLSQRRSVGEEESWSVSVFSFHINCLICAYVGPFNQYLRFSGENADQDFTLITRDFRLTENLLGYLRRLFRGGPAIPASPASSLSSDGEAAVYRSARPSSSEQLREGVEIRFPNDEILSELQFVVEEAVQPRQNSPGLSSSPHGAVLDSSPTLLYYLLLENLSIDLVDYVRCCTANHLMSVLLLAGSGHLVLLRQNVSQFPIPDFARGPPDLAQFSVLEVRPLSCLTHLTLSSCDRRLLTLSFAPTLSGCAPTKSPPGPNSPGLEPPRRPFAEAAAAIGDPVHVTAYIQNARDVDKLVKLVRATWKEHTGADFELPLYRS